ncbi:MAG: hypothetical protein Q9222_002318 [Ikaeria aurantiellina]
MTAVSTIAVILRLMGRKVSAAPYGADDVLIVIALVLTYGLNVNLIIAVHYGFGRHQLMLSLDYISKFLLNDWCVQIIFATAISVTRLSLLVFYHRLFPVKRFTIVATITGCVMVAWWIAFIFAIIFSCIPVASYWNKAIVGHCLDEHTLSWGVTGTELATNMIMLILPIPWLWHLHLEWTKKLALIGIFMLGCFVCISCVVRFPLLATLVQTDASWTLVPAGVWIIVECNIGIASVCLPLMRPLISIELSALSSKIPFVRSRRTPSPFTDEENSIGKLYEKPYDGPSLEVQPHRVPAQSDPPPSKSISCRGHRDVRTHRSRIESYSPIQILPPVSSGRKHMSEQAKPTQPASPRRKYLSLQNDHRALTSHPIKRSSLQSNPQPLTSHPHKHSSIQTNPQSLSSSQSRHQSLQTKPLPPLIPHGPKRTSLQSTTKPAPPSSAGPKHTSLQTTTKPPPQSSSARSNHLSIQTKPPPPSSSRQTRRTYPISSSNPSYPKHAAATSKYASTRWKTYRLSEEEMSERYRKWYSGRGSEVGKGLWGLEIVSPSGRTRGAFRGSDDDDDDVPWEVGEMGERSRYTSLVPPPKSRLSS